MRSILIPFMVMVNESRGSDSPCGDCEHQHQKYHAAGNPIAEARIWCGRERTRQSGVDPPFAPELKSGENAPIGIDHTGNAVIRDTHQRESLLDRAQPRTREMLMRPGGKPKP